MTDLYDWAVAHLVTLAADYDPTGDGVVFLSECSCGWAGDRHDEAALAVLDGDGHRSIAVSPADGLDATISGLLDLQDDLADVVVWLAENWSADLPVPEDRGHGLDGARVELAAYCPTHDALTRAATLLAAPLVDDPAPDSCGHRHRRAARMFGRVRLVVLWGLDPDDKAAA